MPTAVELFGGFWGGVYAIPVVDDYAAAVTVHQWTARPRALKLLTSDRVSPGADGRPTVGYPDIGEEPAWIALTLAGGAVWVNGVDFTVSGGYIWFETDPLVATPLKTLDWATGSPVETTTIWCGAPTAVIPATPPQPSTPAAVATVIAGETDSPCTGPTTETVEAVWSAADGSHRIVTDAACYTLVAADLPGVTTGQVLAPYSALGTAWVLTRLGPGDPTLTSTSTPASFHQGATIGPITWYAADAALVVDTLSTRTRVRFALGGDADDVADFWTQSHANGVANGRTLAQALDTRPNPVGDPGPADLPAFVSPLKLLQTQLLGGCAYQLLVRPARFGSGAGTVATLEAALRPAAGPYATVFVFEDEVPALPLVPPV